MPIPWNPSLRRRPGSRRRLGGLEIYYDFDWKEVFRHNRSAFRNGQSLAQLVARECPSCLRPTLLLTIKDDVAAGVRQVDGRHIVIVPIHDYLRRASADAALTYYARTSQAPLTRLSNAVFTQPELEQFVVEHLDSAAIAAWSSRSEANGQALVELLRSANPTGGGLATLLSGISRLQPVEVDALASRIRVLTDDAGLRRFLLGVTASSSGREAAVQAIGLNLAHRVNDVRKELAEYQELVATSGVTETQVQRLLERYPWIVGLTYVRARARVEIPRGELDFVLYRYDGFLDVLELKGPDEPIVVEAWPSEGRPPSASAYSLGPALAKALAQAHLYRYVLDESVGLKDQYGLSDTRQARVIIVIGRSTDLTGVGREILRQLNLSLHRVEVIPYDVLGLRTEGWLKSIERLLAETDTRPHTTE